MLTVGMTLHGLKQKGLSSVHMKLNFGTYRLSGSQASIKFAPFTMKSIQSFDFVESGQ